MRVNSGTPRKIKILRIGWAGNENNCHRENPQEHECTLHDDVEYLERRVNPEAGAVQASFSIAAYFRTTYKLSSRRGLFSEITAYRGTPFAFDTPTCHQPMLVFYSA